MGAKPPLISFHSLLILLASLLPLLYCTTQSDAVLLVGDWPKAAQLPLKASGVSCDFFRGSWIYDESYPLYDSADCSFIDSEFDCQKYGRLDKLYLKYRWRPSGCELPRFNGGDLLKRWRGKTIMFVGDSISYNQWQSLLCMLHATVPASNISTEKKDPLSSISFEINAIIPSPLSSHLLNSTPFSREGGGGFDSDEFCCSGEFCDSHEFCGGGGGDGVAREGEEEGESNVEPGRRIYVVDIQSQCQL